ncbi:FkbM family methyltransferase [Sphingomonas jaspsi]|uniref:FkbM family methyltransferase n=1 Tax=Sphingomonas jaspsi TaxID=392409 RepID=UPI0006878513|nr:FkbM family methyltransferase [Sphingomonas jaspsi]
MNAIRPSAPLNIIARLPFARRLALRLYNRWCMTVRPHSRARTWFGASMDCDVRDMIQATIIHLGSWEPRLSAILPCLIDEGDVVADVGANIGYYTLLFSKAVGPDGKVVAIEALPRLAERIRGHIALNGAANIEVQAVALSDRSGTVTIHEAADTNIGMTTIVPERGIKASGEVACRRLQDLLSPDDRQRLTLIKIDIEGAEPPVMRDLIDHLPLYSRHPAIAVEVSPSPSWAALFDRLRAEGYRAFDLHNDYDWLALIDEPSRSPSEIDRLPERQADILFVRDEAQLGRILAL